MRRRRGLLPAALTLAAVLLAVVAAAQQDPYLEDRLEMVDQQIRERGIDDDRLLEALEEIPRHEFVPLDQRGKAYADQSLKLSDDLSIHQPYLVARMTQLLEIDRGSKVLEIGTGTGYHAAVLARLSRQVFSIEIDPDLARQARRNLARAGVRNVHLKVGDGYQGWPSEQPFDAIILTTAPPRIPEPLLRQLKVGGKMVVPVGDTTQDLLVVTKTEEGYEKRALYPVSLPRMSGEAQLGRPY